jgi:carnitine 3-dehydrogenase
VERVAVIGTGLIGAGWTAVFLLNGLKTTAWDPAEDFEERLIEQLHGIFSRLQVTHEDKRRCFALLGFAQSASEAVISADFVQESGPEELEIKRSIIADLSRLTSADVVIASSSSGLPMSQLQTDCLHPHRLVIGHPFNPVYLIPLVEIVGGHLTAPETVTWVETFYRSIGKAPVICHSENSGFIANRLQEALFREALHMINSGEATASEIDDVVRHGPGLRWAFMGPLLCYHLGGGAEGLRGFFDRFIDSVNGPYSRLAAPELSDQFIETVLDQADVAFGDRSIEELEQWRDECLMRLLGVLDRKNWAYGTGEKPELTGLTEANIPSNIAAGIHSDR